MNARVIRAAVLAALLWGSTSTADRGLVPLRPGVRVFEPVQQALIAWNGHEELLLLATDVSTSEEAEVLEFLPLPSEPTVSKGDRDLLRRATSLINQHLAETALPGRSYEGKGRAAGTVTFRGQIGIHSITTAKVLDPDGFVGWAEKAVGGLPKDFVLSKQVAEDVKAYIEGGFRWFVFDVIHAGRDAATTDALQYRFLTQSLFYPLRVTSSADGRSRIRLLILTPKLLRDFPGWPADRVQLLHPPIKLRSYDLKTLGGDLLQFFQPGEEPYLRIWEIEDDLKEFDRDLLAR